MPSQTHKLPNNVSYLKMIVNARMEAVKLIEHGNPALRRVVLALTDLELKFGGRGIPVLEETNWKLGWPVPSPKNK